MPISVPLLQLTAFFSCRAGVCWGPEMSCLMPQSTGSSQTSLAAPMRGGARRASGAPSPDLLSLTCPPAGGAWSRTTPSSPWSRAACLKRCGEKSWRKGSWRRESWRKGSWRKKRSMFPIIYLWRIKMLEPQAEMRGKGFDSCWCRAIKKKKKKGFLS